MAPKKKLTKKEKARMEAEQAELQKAEQERERQLKLELERERRQKEREEAEKRLEREIIENKTRRKQLKESIKYFNEIKAEIARINELNKTKKEWEHYMRCDGLPNVKIPGDLRKYLHCWNIKDLERNRNEQNWLLKTNERTLLTHDKDVANLSREFIRKQQENIGDIYSQRIKEVLGILIELDDCLKTHHLSVEIFIDLRQLKSEIRQKLNEFIDDFTFKIMSHVDRDMEATKPGTSHHTYSSDTFKSEVWAILGEALFAKEKFRNENRTTDIEFTAMNLQLSLPATVHVTNVGLRALWFNYDHFSDYCRSKNLHKKFLYHMDILQQTKKEWKKRKEILNSTLEEINKATIPEEYNEEQMQPRTIDIDKIYTEYEEELNKEYRKELGPDGLNLAEFDINLRKYRIVSGVYAIDMLEYPEQDRRLNARSFIKTTLVPSGLTKRFFYHPYKPPPPPAPGVRRLPEEIEAEMKLIEKNLEKLTLITLQLPDNVLWFEPPIVCRWETPKETIEANGDDKIAIISKSNEINENLTLSEIKKQSKTSETLPIAEVADFDLCNIPDNIDLFGIMTEFIIPRLPDGYCIRIECKKFEKKEITSFHYLSRHFNIKHEIPEKKEEYKVQATCAPIIENLIETNSPREFDAKPTVTKILKIKHAPRFKRRSSCFDPINVKDSDLEMSKSYMFSELIEDLQEIYEMQSNFMEEKIDDINSCLSSTSSVLLESDGRRYSRVIIIRETEISDKEKKSIETVEEEESDSEYDDTISINEEKEAEDDLDYQATFGKWSTRDVHDTKFNEDKNSIQFRTGRLGIFGFATNRYSNMPYQTWEIKPILDKPGSIFYSLAAAVINIEMTITSEGFRITNFQGGTTETLTQMIGKIMSLEQMKNTLRNSGADIFPEVDSVCYTEGSCEKNYVMEMHLYNCMSTLALSHNFSWSRWNLLSGSRTAVLLMREYIDSKKPDHSTLLVTPLRTIVVNCTEVSTSFITTGVKGMEFYADLHQLALAHAHPINLEKRKLMDPSLRKNVAQILMQTRPLSFC